MFIGNITGYSSKLLQPDVWLLCIGVAQSEVY